MSFYLTDTYDRDKGTDVWVFPTEEHEIIDGVADDLSFSENISKDEKEKLITLISQQGFNALDEIGWEHDDTKYIFLGPLISWRYLDQYI